MFVLRVFEWLFRRNPILQLPSSTAPHERCLKYIERAVDLHCLEPLDERARFKHLLRTTQGVDDVISRCILGEAATWLDEGDLGAFGVLLYRVSRHLWIHCLDARSLVLRCHCS